MPMKDMPVQIKAGPDDGLGEGEFTAYASVFGNVDSYGDIVVKGAFADDLKRWEESGKTIPLLWGHDFSLHGDIGYVKSATEDDRGLLVHAVLDMEDADGAKAYRRIKGRRVDQMSFAYDVLDSGTVQKDGQEVTELRKLKLHEVSVVMVGANQDTEILAVKAAADRLAAGMKAGRELSTKNIDMLAEVTASLDASSKSIKELLSRVRGEEDDQEKQASGDAEVKSDASDEEPVGAKSSVSDEEPKSSPSVSRLAAQAHIYALMGAERGSR